MPHYVVLHFTGNFVLAQGEYENAEACGTPTDDGEDWKVYSPTAAERFVHAIPIEFGFRHVMGWDVLEGPPIDEALYDDLGTTTRIRETYPLRLCVRAIPKVIADSAIWPLVVLNGANNEPRLDRITTGDT